MILILSNNFDSSTKEVCFWLDKLNGCFRVLDANSLYNEFSSNLLNPNSEFFKSVNVIWNRRWLINDVLDVTYSKNKTISKGIYKNLLKEIRTLDSYFWNQFNDKIWVDKFSNIFTNKLEMLSIAQSVGFNVPDWLITTKKNDLIKFITNHSSVICKSISDNVIFDVDEFSYYYGYTNKICSNILDQFPEVFFPSLFQQEIEKEVEIRTFVFFEEIFSMAIFSQLDQQTVTDFRRYNGTNPNRNIPFKLPNDVENKIREFMKIVGLNSGSFDLILDKSNQIHFIEINPVGQFGMVSKPCNYKLEKKIAEKLIEYDRT